MLKIWHHQRRCSAKLFEIRWNSARAHRLASWIWPVNERAGGRSLNFCSSRSRGSWWGPSGGGLSWFSFVLDVFCGVFSSSRRSALLSAPKIVSPSPASFLLSGSASVVFWFQSLSFAGLLQPAREWVSERASESVSGCSMKNAEVWWGNWSQNRELCSCWKGPTFASSSSFFRLSGLRS